MRVPGTAQHPSSIDPPNLLLRPALRLGTGVRRAPYRLVQEQEEQVRIARPVRHHLCAAGSL
jgi:hypothetical protein